MFDSGLIFTKRGFDGRDSVKNVGIVWCRLRLLHFFSQTLLQHRPRIDGVALADAHAFQGRAIANVSIKGAASVVVALIETSVKPLSFCKISCKKLDLRGDLRPVYCLLVEAAILQTKCPRLSKVGIKQIKASKADPSLRPFGMEIDRSLVGRACLFIIAQGGPTITEIGVKCARLGLAG